MNRRNFLNLAAISTASLLGGCASSAQTQTPQSTTNEKPLSFLREKTKKRVVVVGGGFGGLNTAATICQNDPEHLIEVIVLERNPLYFVCPMSNTLLSGDERFGRDMFLFDYTDAQKEYGYEVIQAEVLEIERASKIVHTSRGALAYDLLVLAPGIEYNYEAEFSKWSQEKIRRAKMEAPGGLISDVGVEHAILKKQLEAFKNNGGEGTIVIVPPRLSFVRDLQTSVPHTSLQRCKPAPYERACMIGNWIKKNNLTGKAKVLILDNAARPQGKAEAFEQVFKELYAGIVEYRGGFDLMDVDFDKKEITYRDVNDDAEYVKATLAYDVLNLIPVQKASSLISKAGLKTNAWGGAVLAKRNFYSVSDDAIYVVGDSAFYGKATDKNNPKKQAGVPAAAQTAYSSAIEAGRMIASRLLGTHAKPLEEFSASCFSMVQTDTNKQLGIGIEKTFTFDTTGFYFTETIPQENGKYYNEIAGVGITSWFDAVTGATFARF